MRNKRKEQCIRNKRLSDYNYSIATYFLMQSLFNVYKSWRIYKIIWKHVKYYKNLFLFSLQATQTNFYGGAFLQKKKS